MQRGDFETIQKFEKSSTSVSNERLPNDEAAFTKTASKQGFPTSTRNCVVSVRVQKVWTGTVLVS